MSIRLLCVRSYYNLTFLFSPCFFVTDWFSFDRIKCSFERRLNFSNLSFFSCGNTDFFILLLCVFCCALLVKQSWNNDIEVVPQVFLSRWLSEILQIHQNSQSTVWSQQSSIATVLKLTYAWVFHFFTSALDQSGIDSYDSCLIVGYEGIAVMITTDISFLETTVLFCLRFFSWKLAEDSEDTWNFKFQLALFFFYPKNKKWKWMLYIWTLSEEVY